MTPSTRKERKKDARRKNIIDTAERLFYAKGFDTVTMDEIAREIDVSKGSLYLHFKSKDSLFFAVVARKHEESLKILEERLRFLPTGGEKLRDIIQWYIDTTKMNPEYIEFASKYGPLIWSRMSADDEQFLAENAIRYNILLKDVITEGIYDGTIRNDLDPVLLGFYITFISMTVTSPLPAWKQSIALTGITMEQFLDNFKRFIDPSITGCPGKDEVKKVTRNQ